MYKKSTKRTNDPNDLGFSRMLFWLLMLGSIIISIAILLTVIVIADENNEIQNMRDACAVAADGGRSGIC